MPWTEEAFLHCIIVQKFSSITNSYEKTDGSIARHKGELRHHNTRLFPEDFHFALVAKGLTSGNRSNSCSLPRQSQEQRTWSWPIVCSQLSVCLTFVSVFSIVLRLFQKMYYCVCACSLFSDRKMRTIGWHEGFQDCSRNFTSEFYVSSFYTRIYVWKIREGWHEGCKFSERCISGVKFSERLFFPPFRQK